MLLNVSNNKMLLDGGLDLERSVCDCAAAAGFDELQPILMLKPTHDGAPTDDITKMERIFVFRKKAAALHAAASRASAPAAAFRGPDARTADLALLFPG